MSSPISYKSGCYYGKHSWLKLVSALSEKRPIILAAPLCDYSDEHFLFCDDRSNIKIFPLPFYDRWFVFYINLLKNPKLFLNLVRQIIRSSAVMLRVPTPCVSILAITCVIFRKPFLLFISGNIRRQSDSLAKSVANRRLLLLFLINLRINLHALFGRFARKVYVVSTEIALDSFSKYVNAKLFRTPVIRNSEIINRSYQDDLLTRDLLRIVRISRIQPSKGIKELLVATAKVAETRKVILDIYGDFPDPIYRKEINDLITEIKHSQYIVTLKGWINHDSVLSTLKNYDLHVVSSKSEGMPRVCLEAALMKVPQVLTPVGGIPDFYKDQKTAFIANGTTVSDIYNALETAITSKNIKQIVLTAYKEGLGSTIDAKVDEILNELT